MDFMGIFKNVWTDFDEPLWVIEIDGIYGIDLIMFW